MLHRDLGALGALGALNSFPLSVAAARGRQLCFDLVRALRARCETSAAPGGDANSRAGSERHQNGLTLMWTKF